MQFFSFFKALTGKKVVVELKNEMTITGTLFTVDQYLNTKLTNISVDDPKKYPHLASVSSIFIRGSVVRYMMLQPDDVDVPLLQDACRRAANASASSAAAAAAGGSA